MPSLVRKCLDDFDISMPAANYCMECTQYVHNGDASQDVSSLRCMVNTLQIEVADTILDAINSPDRHVSKVHYLDGPGECGKTFTYNYLAAAIHA